MSRERPSPVGFKTHFPFRVAICCWVDLLGYGASIARSDFNPLNPLAKGAVRRLRRFHELIASHSKRRFPTLVMNDGAAAYGDLTWNTRWATFEFISDAFGLYQAINQVEAKEGLPGARMVISTGFRLRGRRAGIDDRSARFRRVLKGLQDGTLSHKEAIDKAAKITSNFDVIPQLQANFAFTKAYVAEQSGRTGGLGGANCFLDLAVFEHPLPTWLDIGPIVQWREERLNLQAEFAPLISLPRAKKCETRNGVTTFGGPEGVRDAIQVARYLTSDDGVLAALQNARRDQVRTGIRS